VDRVQITVEGWSAAAEFFQLQTRHELGAQARIPEHFFVLAFYLYPVDFMIKT
jgi:hypothetical protein